MAHEWTLTYVAMLCALPSPPQIWTLEIVSFSEQLQMTKIVMSSFKIKIKANILFFFHACSWVVQLCWLFDIEW